MIKQKRNKDTICATVSPYTRRQVEDLVENGDFGSMSDLVGVALTEFLMKYNGPKTDVPEQNKRRMNVE